MTMIKDNIYREIKQITSVILVNAILWVPMICRVTELEQSLAEIAAKQVSYEAPLVYETFVEEIESETLEVPESTLESFDTLESTPEPIYEVSSTLTDEEIDLIALLTMGEAEGEPEEGKRLVIDSVLNRVDSEHFPDTVTDVIYQPGQYTAMWNTRVDRCYVREDIRDLVIEELTSRTNTDVVFFRTEYYHPFGTPLFQVGNHYFSKY